MNLRDLDLGALAAEDDQALADYFLRTEAFERVATSKKWIVLGNRGVGKTAIFKYLQQDREEAGELVVTLSPEDYSYELASDVLARESAGAWQKSGAYAAAWKWLILLLVMRGLANSAPRARFKPEGRLHSFLRDRYTESASNPIDALIGYLKRIEGLKVGKYEAAFKTRELQRLFKADELAPAQGDLGEALRSRPAWVIVDELDRGWDASEDDQYFVAGLFRAGIALTQVH